MTVWQEAQKDAASAFDDFMDQCMETDWAQDRDRLVTGIMPIGTTPKAHQSKQAQAAPSSQPLMLEAANGKT